MVSCDCCVSPTEEHKLVTCCVCKKQFKHSCVDLSATETRLINSKSDLSWTCKSCSDMGNDINSIKAVLVQLQNEIKELKEVYKHNLNTNNQAKLEDSEFFESVVHEVSDREGRKRNVILFGVPETQAEAGAGGDDSSKALDILSFVTDVITAQDISQIRHLGKLDVSNSKPRPIKVTR